MPVNGLIFAADELELTLASSASGSHSGPGDGAYSHVATGTSLFTPNVIDLVPGFFFEVSGSSATDLWSVTYIGPGAPLGVTWTGSGWASASGRVKLTSVRVYGTGGGVVFQANYEIFAGGVSRLSGSLNTLSGGLGPAYIPFIGVPWGITGSVSASTINLPTYTISSTYDYQSTADATASGGWRFKEVGSGSWQVLPMTLLVANIPSVSCGESTSIAAVSAADTGSLTVPSHSYSRVKRSYVGEESATTIVQQICPDGVIKSETGDPECVDGAGVGPARRDVYSVENWLRSRSGSVRGVPDLEKAINRFNSDFVALWYRTKMPRTQSTASASCVTDGVTVSSTNVAEVHPFQNVLIQEVDENPAAIEDTFGYLSYAPVTANGSASYSKGFEFDELTGSCLCPPSWFIPIPGNCPDIDATPPIFSCELIWPPHDPESDVYSAGFSFPSSVGSSSDMAEYLGHAVALARYINSWCNPHWSFFLWNEPWEVDSSPETWGDYWSKVGSQWIYNTALASPSRIRNHLVSEGLENDGNAGFLNALVGGLRWVGVSRWLTKAVTPRTSYTFDSGSSSLWSGTDCALAHGSAITVNPSATTCEVALDLGSFTVEPFLWPHITDTITADWILTNVDSIRVYLEGTDGTRVLLNDNQAGVAKVRPFGDSTKYAGSWVQDFGAAVVTDLGSDDEPEGESSVVMASPERVFAFQMLRDRTAARLVFVIEVLDVDVDVTLEYPIFEYTKSAQRKLTWENAHQCNIIHPAGPGVRFGNWNTGTSGTLTNPPTIYDGYERPNAIDWRIGARLAVEGVAHDANLTTELATDRDSFEGQSVGNERSSSHGFWLPVAESPTWHLAIVSTLAECPQLGCFPSRERGSDDWLADGDWCQHSWTWAQGPDYIVSPKKALSVFLGSVWTSAAVLAEGWFRSSHQHVLNNAEAGAKIRCSSKEIATVRPWRGFYGVFAEEEPGTALWNLHTPWGHFHRISANADGVVHHRANHLIPIDGFESEEIVVAGAIEAVTAYSPAGIMVAVVKIGTEVKTYECYDDGETYKEMAALFTNSPNEPFNSHVLVTRAEDRLATVFRYDSGSSGAGKIFRRYRGKGEASYSSDSPIEDASSAIAFENDRHCITESPDGTLVLTAKKAGDTAVTEWYSHDNGETWTEV